MTARIEFMPIETRALSDVSVHPVRHDHARAEPASARGEHLFGFILPLVLRKVRIEREQPLLAVGEGWQGHPPRSCILPRLAGLCREMRTAGGSEGALRVRCLAGNEPPDAASFTSLAVRNVRRL